MKKKLSFAELIRNSFIIGWLITLADRLYEAIPKSATAKFFSDYNWFFEKWKESFIGGFLSRFSISRMKILGWKNRFSHLVENSVLYSNAVLLKEKLEKIFCNRQDQYEVYETKFENDATMEIKRKLQERDETNPNLHVRIYSAGGDGTAFECANGVYGYNNVSFAILPTGSCNDFLKSFPDVDFGDLEKLVEADAYPLDVLKVNDKINIRLHKGKINAIVEGCEE